MGENHLDKAYVKDIMNLVVEKPATAFENDSIDSILKKVIEDPVTRHVYIIDENHKLIGSIRVNYLIEILFPKSYLTESRNQILVSSFMNLKAETAGDIMNHTPDYVKPDSKLEQMVSKMLSEKINEMPVVNDNMELIGEVNILEIIAYYLKMKKEREL